LSANVDKKYVEAKSNPDEIKYVHPIIKEVLGETYGFLVFQEQLSLLAHKLGKDISLDEGNELRKVLTKKGTGKEAEVKNKLYQKFIDGCLDKDITKEDADTLWKNMEFFSGYGFNLSHATCYSILSYQCAYLLTYYPSEWVAAYLSKESEKKKELAISIAKSLGFEIRRLDINKSTANWEVDPANSKILIQPLASIKGVGDAAIEEIIKYRPFANVEELLFHPEMAYNRVNKRVLDAICRSGGLDCLKDDRFTGMKHLWSACVVDRPKTIKKLSENIALYAPEGEFTTDEILENTVSLSGVFPVSLVVNKEMLERFESKNIPQISEYEQDIHQACWFIMRECKLAETKSAKPKPYWILTVTDSTGTNHTIKVWGVNLAKDKVFINRPYAAIINQDGWGKSCRSPSNLKLMG
jgi:DNA polymerase III alpha subunit